MRVAVLVAMSALIPALVMGCSPGVDGDAEPDPTLSGRVDTTGTPLPTTTVPRAAAAPTQAPVAGAEIGQVAAWVEAGAPADADGYHSAVREGQTTQLDDDIAFVTASGANCMTDARYDGELACLVELSNPPPRPAQVEGEWKGGWVDFTGPTVEIGSAHADPGRFASGTGAELPVGQSLAFGDYRCRADQAGLYCVNYAHRSAVQLADDGVEAFGCLREVSPPADIGAKFSCQPE